MARFNEILAGRYNRGLQKLLSMKGEPPAPQLASDIQPVLPLFLGSEARYLEGWNKFSNNDSVTGGAAQFAAVRFRNPVGSGVIAVIEKASIHGAAADRVNLIVSQSSADLNIVAIGVTRLDSRGQQNPVLILSDSTNFTRVSGLLQARLGVGGNYDFIITDNQEIPLLPGDAVTFQSNTAATELDISMMWRERVLEDSEKT